LPAAGIVSLFADQHSLIANGSIVRLLFGTLFALVVAAIVGLGGAGIGVALYWWRVAHKAG